MTDVAALPIGSEHLWSRGGVTHRFSRMPTGWNDGRRLLDDAAMDAEGWLYVGPAG